MEYRITRHFNHETFREEAKKLLRERKITYTALAKEIGYSVISIKHYMSGVTDSRFVAMAVASYLNALLEEGKKNEEGKN